MKLLQTRSDRMNSRTGVLFRQSSREHPLRERKQIAPTPPETVPPETVPPEIVQPDSDSKGKHRLAFAGLYLTLLLMYVRPQEVFPEVFGSLPMAKIATIATILFYFYSKLKAGEKLISWPLEMKMVAVIWTLGLIFMPFAASRQDSFDVLFDPFIKTIIVFVILINLVDTHKRLRSLWHILVICQLLYALGAIRTFMAGGYDQDAAARIQGWGTMFANPNDLASIINLMLPFAVIFALTQRGWRRVFYSGCALLASVGVFVTFSRSGFIGLVITCLALLWKLFWKHRVKALIVAVVVSAVLVLALPGGYRARLSTIFSPETDKSNSAQERQLLMKRGAELAVKRAFFGIGMGNFHIYSISERAAHNSYLEISTELSVFGLLAYLILIFAPFRSLLRIARETRSDAAHPRRDIYVTAICLQASFIAYIVYGFFGSVQYLNFLYFSVAYVVVFRKILAAEKSVEGNDASRAPETPVTKGTLWKPRQSGRLQLSEGTR